MASVWLRHRSSLLSNPLVYNLLAPIRSNSRFLSLSLHKRREFYSSRQYVHRLERVLYWCTLYCSSQRCPHLGCIVAKWPAVWNFESKILFAERVECIVILIIISGNPNNLILPCPVTSLKFSGCSFPNGVPPAATYCPTGRTCFVRTAGGTCR